MKRIYILITTLIISFNSFCQDTTYYFSDVYEKGAVEFVANKTKFRINVKDPIEQTYIIEKFNIKWVIVDSIDQEYSHFYLEDINDDGFDDLVLNDKWQTEIYFFNPIKKTFIHTGTFSCTEDKMISLDRTSKIYYDYQPYKGRFWSSYLFKIRNYERINLGAIHVEGKYSEKLDAYIPIYISISKIDEKTEEEKLIAKPNPKKSFNYATYWKLNWRKFLR